ncbi:MAG: hypothetical protein ACJAUR_002108 [Ulvibacter sp.]|jgi:hypothetical protein
MKKVQLGLLLLICSLKSLAQENNFFISNTFFDGQKVILFSENRGGALVLLEDNSLYFMNRHQEFSEVTEFFSDEIRNDITCIETINEYMFFIGTGSNSLIKYDEGIITHLKDINQELPIQINSIDFNGFYSQSQLMVATSDNIWVSTDMSTFTYSEESYATSTKFFGGRQSILLTEYPYCTQIPGDFGLKYSYSSNVTLFRLFENEGFDIQKLNDVLYAKRGFGSGTYNTYVYYATDNGVYTQHVNSCSSDTTTHFKNTSVKDLQLVSSGLTKSTLFAACDSGLLYLEASSGQYFNVSDPQYFIMDGIDSANTVNYSTYHNVIWVGTNIGLLQLFDDQLTQQSLDPDPIEFDTINFCLEEGTYPNVNFDDQLNRQWYLDGEKIDGALSRSYHTMDEGLYSVKYIYDNQEYYVDVAYVQLDATFNERISEQDYLVCPTDRHVLIPIENYEYYEHDYNWYSVERGLEFEAGDGNPYYYVEEAGNYYFISTNCNGYTYRSDTVEAIKSQLQQPYFDLEFVEGSHCVEDTIFINGIDNAVNFSWRVDYDLVENYNEPYIVLEIDNFEDDLFVTTSDENGCELTARADLGYVLEPPFLSEDQVTTYICEPEAYVYFDVPFGSSVIWEGYSNGETNRVSPGTYPVTVSNDVCEDFSTTVQIDYFNPLPELDQHSIFVLVNDTLKISVNSSETMHYYWPVQRSMDQSFLYVTSTELDTIQAQIIYPSPDCSKNYSFDVYFVDELPLGVKNDISAITIFPNPTSDRVRIDTDWSNITRIQLLDLNGSVISSRRVENDKSFFFEFPPNINNGIYVLQIITSNDNSIIRRVIFNK